MPFTSTVFVCHSAGSSYPDAAPFNPGVAYPEYRGAVGSRNDVYDMVRECFRLAGLDAGRFGTAEWSPLSELIRPGETVVLKPNLVKEQHPRDREGWRYVITHGSVVRAVGDYVAKALGNSGRIVLADAPQADSSFRKIVEVLRLDRIRDHFQQQGIEFSLVDLRRDEVIAEDGVVVSRRELPGDPAGCVAFNLGAASEFAAHRGGGRYYGADYNCRVVNEHHTGGRHEYLLAGSVIKADVVFSLPKLKTHKKAGVTVSLKNLVGINGDKNWLPHHTEGAASQGGDERPRSGLLHRLERSGARMLRRLSLAAPTLTAPLHKAARSGGVRVFGDTETVVRSGNWWGNDTVWRMCLDLNKALLYGNPDGTMRTPTAENRKRHFVLVDGVIAGEGSGPMNPDPVEAGVLLFGADAPCLDAAAAYLMGFDPERIPIVANAFHCLEYPLTKARIEDVRLVSNRAGWNGPLRQIPDSETFHFKPHFGWIGRIERAHAPHLSGR